MRKLKIYTLLLTAAILITTVTACTSQTTPKKRTNHIEKTTESGTYNATVVVRDNDTENRRLAFVNIADGARETYRYTNGTSFLSRNKSVLSSEQIRKGDVVDIIYDGSHEISSIQVSPSKDVWENSKVTTFAINDNDGAIKIGQTMYYYTDGIVVLSGDEEIDITELNNTMDQLVVRGYKNQVVSVVVEKGHGYVSLTGDSLFIGGLINVGNVLARRIEPDMLLPVTEGEYLLEVVNGDYKSEKKITVERGKETVVDFSDVPANVTQTGNIRFMIDVQGASLYIDGMAYDYSSIITLKNGKHNVVVHAEGYSDYKQVIDVESRYMTVNISMTKGDNETTSSEEPTTTKVEGETYVSSKNKVTVKGPANAVVYFDGTYKGVAPVSFPLVTGEHIISILSGTKINSYTVNLADGADDVTYDFTDK